MRDRFYLWLAGVSTWPRIGLLLASCAVVMGAFAIRENVLILDARGDHGGVPDTCAWYAPQDLVRFFSAIGKPGRDLYAATQLTLDFLFPFLYSGLLCCLTVKLWPRAVGRSLVWLPVAAGLADLSENSLLTLLAWTFHDGEPGALATGALASEGLAWTAACFTATKFGLLTLSLIGMLAGFVVWLAGGRPARS